MAVLSKIRQRSFFLIIIIALALFSFVLADVIQSGTFSTGANNVGSVNGTDIEAKEFMQNVSNIEKQGQGTSTTQAMNSAWEQEVRRIILTEEFDKLGLKIGNEQLINVIKQNPNLAQNPQFLNAAGQFDENKFKEFLKGIKNAPDQTQWTEWKTFEKNIERYAVEQMYNTMIKSGVYTTKAEGKFQYKLENDKVDFEYVTVAFSTVNDDQVKVTDAEIIDFMKKSPKKYKSENTTSIDFVLVENKPSKEDEQAMLSSIGDVKVKFDSVAVANVGEFVNANSDIKFDSTYLAKKDLPLDYQEALFNLPVGGVYGPYVFNGHQCISRMIAKKGNASAKASHILLAYKGAPQSTATRTKEEAQALANDLLAQAKANPGNFAMLAMTNSDDPGSKNNGGEYDNITPGQMVPKFNDFVFNNPVGSIGVVETDFGFHVIKFMDKYDAVLMGTVAQKIQPSEATIDAINSEIGNKFHKYSNEEASKVEAIVEGISSGRIPEDKILPSLIKAIHLYPYNRDTYILFLSNFGDHDRSLEAIMNYFQLKPDVVTMDISMPVMNGITALKQIINKDPQANVIMVTAVGQEEFIKEAVLNGAKYFIVKPLEEEFVVNTINRILTC